MSQSQLPEILLRLEAVKLSPHDLFTWTSGIKSPIYCDNRKLISHPKDRNTVISELTELIKAEFPQTDCLAGVATAGIPHAAFLAQELNLPMIYIRSSEKGHGLKNRIEGELSANPNILVIEDLVSSGKSSLAAAQALVDLNIKPVGALALFSYGFNFAHKLFEDAQIPLKTLSNLQQILDYAILANFLSEDEKKLIEQWKNKIESKHGST